MTARGGRIPPDGRPPQARGVGRNAKRHDLERPKTPGLHGSDLQQGDVQALEQGQRIAPPSTQERGRTPEPGSGAGAQPPQDDLGVEVPDALEFFGDRLGGSELTDEPSGGRAFASKGETWIPILQMLASKPGTSGVLAQALIHQTRRLRELEHLDAKVIDMTDADDAIEAMLDEGI